MALLHPTRLPKVASNNILSFSGNVDVQLMISEHFQLRIDGFFLSQRFSLVRTTSKFTIRGSAHLEFVPLCWALATHMSGIWCVGEYGKQQMGGLRWPL